MEINQKAFLPVDSCAITNGPSKYDLQASLFDKKVVQFSIDIRAIKGSLEIGQKFDVSVRILGQEDSSAESWIGEFNVMNPQNLTSESRAFYYDTRNRKGTISEADKKWTSG